MEGIVATDDVMGGEPRLAGRRIAVRQIAELILDGDNSPAEVADQLDISLSDVHLALAYYYDNPDEMAEVRERHHELMREARKSALSPPDTVSR